MNESADKVQECYAIEDNSEALNCLKKVVKEATGECKPRLVLFTQDGCPHCEDEKKLRKNDIAQGVIQVMNLDSLEGLAIARKNDIDFVPALVLLDCQDNIIEPSD